MKNKKYLMIGVSLVLVGGLIFFFVNDKLIKLENKDADNIEQEVIVEDIDDSEEKDSEIEEDLDLETEEDLEKPEVDEDIKDNEATNTNAAQKQNQQKVDEDPFEKIKQLIEESTVEIEEDTGEPAEKIYQRISSKYVSKLENASKKLIEELRDEEKNNTNGLFISYLR